MTSPLRREDEQTNYYAETVVQAILEPAPSQEPRERALQQFEAVCRSTNMVQLWSSIAHCLGRDVLAVSIMRDPGIQYQHSWWSEACR